MLLIFHISKKAFHDLQKYIYKKIKCNKMEVKGIFLLKFSVKLKFQKCEILKSIKHRSLTILKFKINVS